MSDAQTGAWLDQEDAHTAQMVREYGWYIEYVYSCTLPRAYGPDAEGPPFAYTIGMFGLRHPELLMVGISPDIAGHVFNNLGRRIRVGEALLPGHIVTVEGWPVRMIPEVVPNPGEIVRGANRYYDRPADASVPVLQLSYEDNDGRFPWEPEYVAPHMQPRPGSFAA